MDLIPSALTKYTLENYLIRITKRSQAIYWIIILFVVTGITILPFIYVDVCVQARGYFQSEIERQSIYSPFQGKIIYTSIKNGGKINKGDTLFIIDSEAIKAKSIALENKIRENNLSIGDLKKLTTIETHEPHLKEKDFNTKRYFSEYSRMIKSLAIQFQKYQKTKLIHERNEVLHKQDIIPAIEFENSIFAFKSEEENLNHILISHTSVWQADLMQRINDSSSLEAEYESCREGLNDRIVTAPVSGEIIQSIDIQEGAIIGVNQKVAEISPAGNLIATCFVKPGDIGLLNINQKARIQIDAFNYSEWGLLDASIIDISDDMVINEGSNAYFRIKCRPEKTYLSLKNGVKAELIKGMSFNARIIITRRSLFNLLFDKTDKWFNPYMNQTVI